MRLSADNNGNGKTVDHVRLDLIGRAGTASELWWVGRAFADGSTQPEGMFADKQAARELADKLAASLGVKVVVTEFASQS